MTKEQESAGPGSTNARVESGAMSKFKGRYDGDITAGLGLMVKLAIIGLLLVGAAIGFFVRGCL